MGIWSDGASGNDINALVIDKYKGLIFTADDYGYVKCFNYPCVMKSAPFYKMKGHSSHVMDIKLLYQKPNNTLINNNYNSFVITVGGNDNSIIIWKIVSLSNNK